MRSRTIDAASRRDQVTSSTSSTLAYRAFTDASPWNKPIPKDAIVHANSDSMLTWVSQRLNNNARLTLAGVDLDPWGTPQYWASNNDPVYDVTLPSSGGHTLPTQFSSLRIPKGAVAGAGTDLELSIYDTSAGYVAWLYNAVYDSSTDTWTARGGSIAYLDGNGVASNAVGGDSRNGVHSHRGLNGALVAYRYDEYVAGEIHHALRFALSKDSSSETQWIYPMVGSDGISANSLALRPGARLRLKQSAYDATFADLHGEAKPLVQAMKDYGIVLSDSTSAATYDINGNVIAAGGAFELKCESTIHHTGDNRQRWTMGTAAANYLITDFEVLDYATDWNAAPVGHASGDVSLAPPPIPTNFTTAVSSDTSIEVSWDSVPRAGSYDVKQDATTQSGIATTTRMYSELTPGSTHAYQVRAVNGPLKSYYTSSKLATTTGTGPDLGPVTLRMASTYDVNGGAPSFTVDSSVAMTDTCVIVVGTPSSAETYGELLGWSSLTHVVDGSFSSCVYYATNIVAGSTITLPLSTSGTANRGVLFMAFTGGSGDLDGSASLVEDATPVSAHVCPGVIAAANGSMFVSILFDRSTRSSTGFTTSTEGWTIPPDTKFYNSNGASPYVAGAAAIRTTQASAGEILSNGATIVGASTSTAAMWTLGIKKA